MREKEKKTRLNDVLPWSARDLRIEITGDVKDINKSAQKQKPNQNARKITTFFVLRDASHSITLRTTAAASSHAHR